MGGIAERARALEAELGLIYTLSLPPISHCQSAHLLPKTKNTFFQDYCKDESVCVKSHIAQKVPPVFLWCFSRNSSFHFILHSQGSALSHKGCSSVPHCIFISPSVTDKPELSSPVPLSSTPRPPCPPDLPLHSWMTGTQVMKEKTHFYMLKYHVFTQTTP